MTIEIKPGVELTPEQKAELAKENEKITADAHIQAANRREQDEREHPLVQTVADSIKDKLQKLPPEEEGQ
jgi:hypothetical protein